MNITRTNWLKLLKQDILARQTLYPDGGDVGRLTSTNWLKKLRDDILKNQRLYPGGDTRKLTANNFLHFFREEVIERGSIWPEKGLAGLTRAINNAQSLLTQTQISVTGADIASNLFWATQSVHNTLNSAITAAQSVANNTAATDDQLDNAITTLNAAIATFRNVRQPGTAANKAALNTAISNAQSTLTGTPVSTNGGDIPSNQFWVTQAVRDTLQGAITAAQSVRDNAIATQSEVNDAVTTLNAAITTFNSARQPGTAANKAALISAISSATSALNGTPVSADGSDIAPTAFWVTQAVHDTLQGAINTAQGVVDNPAATQTEANNAVTTLNTAVSTFNAARQAGTQTVSGPNWEITFTQPSQATMNMHPIPISNWTGFQPSMIDDLETFGTGVYNSDWTPTGRARLLAQYVGQQWDEIPLDDARTSATNTLNVWQWDNPNIIINGSNATGQPIQLRFILGTP